jgi:hypothetical protein
MPEVPMMPFQPLPVSVSVGTEQFDSGRAVKVFVSLPSGLTMFALTPDTADEVAANLKKAAQDARSASLIVPHLKVLNNGHESR